MDGSVATTSAERHAEYRRHARRIRGAFAGAPALRVRALRELARRHDARPQRPIHPIRPSPAASFADVVRGRMDGPVLRYSHRTRLLHHAERCGIGRFEANLIIAAVQHEVGQRRDVEPVRPGASWVSAVLGFVATQGAIASGIWLLLG